MKHAGQILIAFDLDDTLYPERDYVQSGRRAVARHCSTKYSVGEGLLFQAMDECPIVGPAAFNALLELLKHTAIDIPEILEVYRNHRPDIALSEDAIRTLTFLKDSGVNLALITDGRTRSQRLKFDSLGLAHFFPPEAVTISGELGADKLSPLPFRTLERLFPAASRRIYIGDNPAKDFLQPRMRGWSTVMLANSSARNVHHQNLLSVPPENRPDMVVFSLTDILPIITEK